MATTKDPQAGGVLKPEHEAPLLDVRRTFLFAAAQLNVPDTISTIIRRRGITFWEQLRCVGYNPQLSLLEATININRATGYSGGLCSAGSTEYVRFFIDWLDGAGYQDVGIATMRVHDIPDTAPLPKHPLSYLVQLPLDVRLHQKLCQTPLLPKVHAVLSWNTPPSMDPSERPLFGNAVATRIQIAPRRRFLLAELAKVSQATAPSAATVLLDKATSVAFKPQAPDIEVLARDYERDKVPQSRLVFGAFHPMFATEQAAGKIAQPPVASLATFAKLQIDTNQVLQSIADTKADTTFEQLTCIGLSPNFDTLGAIIRVKKSSGYNGGLCTVGSNEHVAFWADWNNNGSFDQYLGTASVVVHDISGTDADNIDYAVKLHSREFAEHLRNCSVPMVVRIRGVLSWSTPPSTTDPNDLQTWGNRLDVLVQLRPRGVIKPDEVGHVIIAVGGVFTDDIDPATKLAYPTVTGIPGSDHYRPWGGAVEVRGYLFNSGPARSTFYQIQYKASGSGESEWRPVTAVQSYEVINPLTWWDPTHTVTETAVNGWLPYLEDLTVSPPVEVDRDLMATWNTHAVADGAYDLRLLVTQDNPATNPAGVEKQRLSITVCNLAFTVDVLHDGASVDTTRTFDIVIQGGGCKLYSAGSNFEIPGHLRVVHPYFGYYSLEILPTAAALGATVAVDQPTACTALGDDGPEDGTWHVNVNQLSKCGFTVTLRGYDRTIVNSNGSSRHGAAKAVGFAVF